MTRLLIFLLLLVCVVGVKGQKIGQIRYDTTKFTMGSLGNAEVQILNSTRDSTNGVFLNVGNGVGQFTRIRAISASQFVVGSDTITITGAGSTGSVETASNGLNKVVDDIQLGGLLTSNVTVGSVADNFGVTFARLGTSASISLTAVSNVGTAFNATSTSGTALIASTGTGLGAFVSINPSTTNSIDEVLRVVRTTSGTPATGIGGSINYVLEASDGSSQLSSQIASKWTTTTLGSRTGMLEFYNTNLATPERKLAIAGNGALIADDYGGGTFTGTATFNLAVDVNGNIIEVATSGATPNLNAVLTSGAALSSSFTITHTSNTLNVNASAGVPVSFQSADDVAAIYQRNDASTNINVGMFSVNRLTTGTAANGIAASTDYYIENGSGGLPLASRLITSLTSVTAGATTARFAVNLSLSGTVAEKLAVTGAGQLVLPVGYGGGTHTGTPTFALNVDASGNVIAGTLPAASVTTTGSNGASTLTSGVLNIPQYTISSYDDILNWLGSDVVGESPTRAFEVQGGAVMVDGQIRLVPVRMRKDTLATGIRWWQHVVATGMTPDNENGASLFSYDGAGNIIEIATTGNVSAMWTTGSSAQLRSEAFTSPVAVTRRLYYVGLSYQQSAIGTVPQIGVNTAMVNAALGAVGLPNNAKLSASFVSATLSTPIALSGASNATVNPWIQVY